MTETSLYSTIVETTRALIIVLDAEGRVVMFNPACERVSGYRFEEVRGRVIWDFLLTPEEREPVKAVFRDLLEGHFPNTHENYWVAKSGEGRFIEWSNSAVTDNNGRVTHVIGTGIDVTGRRDAEVQLRESQEQFQEVASAIPVALWIRNPRNGRILYVSPGFETIWGRPLPGLERAFETFRDSIHPDDRETVLRQLQNEAVNGEPADSEFRILRSDGAVRWIQSHSLPIRDEHGVVYRIVGYSQDITDRKSAEQAMRETRQRQKALLDGIPDAAWLVDANFRYIEVNRRFAERWGCNPPDVAGKTASDILPPALAEKMDAENREVLRTGRPLHIERCYEIQGKAHWLEVTKVPVMDSAGGITGIAGVSRDITERKLVEAQRIARDAAQRDALVKEVHHRIKNNLQGTITLIQELASGHPESEDLLESAIARLNTIAGVHGLYGATGARELRLEQIIQTLVSSLQGLHGRPPMRLSVNSPLSARVSENEIVPLALILNELIMNAIKHSRAAEDNDFVQIALESAGNGARIVIRNRSGKLPRYFDFDAGTGLGTGLGLVRSLLPPVGMALHFENAPGRPGTEVELTLCPPVITLLSPAASPSIATREPVHGAHPDRRG